MSATTSLIAIARAGARLERSIAAFRVVMGRHHAALHGEAVAHVRDALQRLQRTLAECDALARGEVVSPTVDPPSRFSLLEVE